MFYFDDVGEITLYLDLYNDVKTKVRQSNCFHCDFNLREFDPTSL